ncbi:MAG: hypothetical protein DRJ03_05570 [Chloroflexi bacterium]|nr:MAG: hypothetical protein DRJ03_05570 [Chloroflexota bacterium]
MFGFEMGFGQTTSELEKPTGRFLLFGFERALLLGGTGGAVAHDDGVFGVQFQVLEQLLVGGKGHSASFAYQACLIVAQVRDRVKSARLWDRAITI